MCTLVQCRGNVARLKCTPVRQPWCNHGDSTPCVPLPQCYIGSSTENERHSSAQLVVPSLIEDPDWSSHVIYHCCAICYERPASLRIQR